MMISDDFESPEDFEDTETLISRKKPPAYKPMKKTTKKGSRRPGSPMKGRIQSAPTARTGKDLWMAAVKRRQTMGIAQGKHPESPRHKTPIEYWVDTLRKTGTGISTESTSMNTFTGLKKGNELNMAYLSSPHYLRQMMGPEKSKKYTDDPTVKPAAGTPAYKSREEYYDEVLELRKQIAALGHENSTMKAKVRRLEEDNIKKEKEMGSLLDPGKSEELRRTLADRKPDSGAVIHSLKQKILKLEMQLRDKENSYAKLQSDLKTTKIEEMKMQLEVFCQEIMRLQHSRDTGIDKSRHGKENSVKVKALNETILRLSKTNEQLQQENRGLKEDLQKALDDTTAPPSGRERNREYEDMNRKQLLQTIYRLDKRLNQAERRLEVDTGSLVSLESRKSEIKGKLVLTGSTQERLQQLDQRETELLEEIDQLKAKIRRLREERSQQKRKEDKQGLGPVPSPRQRRKSTRLSDDEDRQRKVDEFQKKHAASSIQKQWRNRRQQQQEEKMDRRVQAFRENRAAKHIQHEWINYKQRRYDDEMEDVAYLLQGSMRGNKYRRERIQNYHSDDYDTDVTESEGMDDAAYMIQSSLRGHQARRAKMRTMRMDSTGDEDDEYDYRSRKSSSITRRPSSAKRPSSGYRRTSATFHTRQTTGAVLDDDDDDIEF